MKSVFDNIIILEYTLSKDGDKMKNTVRVEVDNYHNGQVTFEGFFAKSLESAIRWKKNQTSNQVLTDFDVVRIYHNGKLVY